MNIKEIIFSSGLTLTEVARQLGERRGKPYSVQMLNNKILYKTIRLSEVEEILDMAKLELCVRKKEKDPVSE